MKVVLGRLLLTTRTAAAAATGAAVGAAVWTATEYAMHRWVLHGPFGRGRLSRIPIGGLHRAHHADPDHTAPLARIAGHIAIAAVGLGGGSLAARAMPRAVALAAGGAWSAGYSTYELVHWNAHHRAPRTAWGRRVRERHFRHHFGAPSSNLGVTTPVWDRLLGTEADPASGTIRVPARFAPEWLDRLGDEFTSGKPALATAS